MALAVFAGNNHFALAAPFVSEQAGSEGFIQESSLDPLPPNYYFNRDGKSGSGGRVDRTPGLLTPYESGFHQ
ncbi:outer membrane porin, OprD family, partial [Pseudomonas aeruginosa]|nr:outer membrane porin, OprD family [Pseudomonas aeruginosa]